eukprot:7888639-Pyramimonas_sp.AAC.1
MIELPPSSDSDSGSISPCLGPGHPKPKKRKGKSPGDDLNPGDVKRLAGQPAEQHADRQRSRGPAVTAAAARFQGTSKPTPKGPAPRRGPTPGRTPDRMGAYFGGRNRGCIFQEAH